MTPLVASPLDTSENISEARVHNLGIASTSDGVQALPQHIPRSTHRPNDIEAIGNNYGQPNKDPEILQDSTEGYDQPPLDPSITVDRSARDHPARTRQRSESPSASRSPTRSEPKAKRQRSRVHGEQLEQLEHFFGSHRSPTMAQRKLISEQVGMSERQVQIWFQNRCVLCYLS